MEVLTYTARNVPLLSANFKECSIFFSRKIPQHPAAPYHSPSITARPYSSTKGVLAYFPFPFLIEFDGHSMTKNILDRNILKGKEVPLQAWSGPEGSRNLRFPDFMTTAQDGGKVVSFTHRPHLPLGNTPGTHFC